jgi:hypothetical protein
MERSKLRQLRHQPLRGEERRDGEPQAHHLGIAGRPLHRQRQSVDRRPDLRHQPLSVGVEMDRLVAPLEQRVADEPLKRLNPAGQGRRGQRQRLRGRLDRAQASDLDEGLDRGERRQSAHGKRLSLCTAAKTRRRNKARQTQRISLQ